MKKLALVLMAGVVFSTANAQFQFGAKGGLNVSTLSGSDIKSAESHVNINLGVYARLPIARRVSLQPELVFSGQGAKFSNPDESFPINYLNVPLLLRFGLGEGFAFYTGPQLGFLLSAHDKFNGTSTDIKNVYKSADFSWAVGFGYRIPTTNLGLDARYNFGISNIEDQSASNSNGSIRNGVFQLGVTYILFSTRR
jgi:Outer membrane protein beta-barrel domain